MLKKVNTDKAPKAIGPYSQGIIHNNLIYTSGQIAIDPENQEFQDVTIEDQTILVLNNLKSILESQKTNMENVIKVTIYLDNMDNFSVVNGIYEKYFLNKPARSTVEVSRLPKNALIEMDCIATL